MVDDSGWRVGPAPFGFVHVPDEVKTPPPPPPPPEFAFPMVVEPKKFWLTFCLLKPWTTALNCCPMIVGVVWTFSLLGLIGLELSLVTISGLPILIGLGIDFAIQIHNRVEEEVVLDKDEHPIAAGAAVTAAGVTFVLLPWTRTR